MYPQPQGVDYSLGVHLLLGVIKTLVGQCFIFFKDLKRRKNERPKKLVQDRLKMTITPNSANLVKECEESNAPPIQCELSISTRTFLNSYDVGKRKLYLGVTVSTIPKQDKKHLIQYCGDYSFTYHNMTLV